MSNMACVGTTQQETDSDEAQLSTDRQRKIRSLSDFVSEELPYLRELNDEPVRSGLPRVKLCVVGSRLLLGVSRMLLYHRKTIKVRT